MPSKFIADVPDLPDLSLAQKFLKRTFDLSLGILGLTVLSPLILGGWIAATMSSGKNGFFLQNRVGRNGKLFKVIKLRTMREIAGFTTTTTTERDPRITRVGQFLRVSKLDELPQLINVVLGQMSFVGPRPDVPGYADCLQGPARAILNLRPGITGPATLEFRDEQRLLADQADPEAYNQQVIWPRKVELNLQYIREYSFGKDIGYILQTALPNRRSKP
jgi:lipopolysaccharide/colanic/teichoic acid biosynthesis glycosyltransferase